MITYSVTVTAAFVVAAVALRCQDRRIAALLAELDRFHDAYQAERLRAGRAA